MIIIILFLLLFSNALALRKDQAIFYSRNTILTILTASYICYSNLFLTNLDKGLSLYGGLFNITSLSQIFNLFILIISGIILIYNSFYHRQVFIDECSNIKNILLSKQYKKSKILPDTKLEIYSILEYPLIILFIITGAVFLMSSGDLISLFIAIELQSYGLYILSTLHRDSEHSTWAGLTYFLLGGLSSCFILLGSSLIYINTGTTSLDQIYIITSIGEIWNNTKDSVMDTLYVNNGEYILNNIQGNNLNSKYLISFDYINISMIILIVGFLFKISAAPFHFWSPDVYDSIPTTVTTYVAIVAKISIFILLFELVYYLGYINNSDTYNFTWKNCLLISSLFSLIIGSLLGLTQYRIKRVYAYSTISHVGFILLALSINSVESITAYIFYIISYTITNLNAFVILVSIGITMYFYVKSDHDNTDMFNSKSKIAFNFNNITKSCVLDIRNLWKLFLGKRNLNNLGFVNEKNNFFTRFTHFSHSSHSSSDFNSLDLEIASKKNEIKAQKAYKLDQDKNFYFENTENIKEINYSPIQLVNQLKGFFYINPYLSLSLAITLFSFMGKKNNKECPI